jgi:hypothetical protein
VRAEPVLDSTRGPALPYPADMRSSTILIPLLFILANDVRCKDDAPAGGEFGEPCGGDEGTPCAEGLECYIGYCEEKCDDDNDCQPIDGFGTSAMRSCATSIATRLPTPVPSDACHPS